MAKIIGIDLGTTNSCVAVMEGGEPKVVPNEEGGRTTPSVVGFTKTGERLVGQVAKRQAITNPENTVYSIKRFMGRRYDEVGEEIKMVPYKVIKSGDHVAVLAQGKEYTPPQISAMILQKLKKAAEDYLGEKVTEAVITVPAYFNDAQRQATKDAGQIAGLDVKRIINEPTAAALAYGLDKKKDETIAVYDFGGGTFDISILEVGEGVIEVKATNGDTHLGGDNIDQKLVDWLIDEFKKDEGLDLRGKGNEMALQRLRDAAERAKIELSTTMETEINLPFITADAGGPKHLVKKLTRAKLEGMVEDIIQKSVGPCKQCMKDAGVDASKINEVVLVGGQTRMPRIQQLVKELFGKEGHKGVNPDEVVAVGAAIQGGVLKGEVKDLLLLDVTPLTLAIETLGGVATPMIPRNTTIPTRKSETFSTAADNQTSVEVHVLQGERPMAAQNRTLGKFHLTGIPPAPRGLPQIEVTFDIDANGILNVTAKDNATGKDQKITITSSSGLSKEEVESMAKDAESHAAEDKAQRESIDSKNQLDTMVYQIEKMMRESGDKISGAERGDVENALADAKKALESNDKAQMDRARETLTQASHKLAEQMYKAAQPAPGAGPTAGPEPGANGGGQKKDEGVIDAEYVDVEDKK
ncbi:MAG: molecular chaperone DnaK [Acidobacteria bacterium]|jgi:molecular chaperone DnaK|nr:MAG: molecular chaperone DnaK [Acidobacteriota bacterium]PYV88375.1 MAG: molecular chaperone DnaK [Acidobacteriota bacterium]